MKIFVPTRGRVGKQITLQHLTPALRQCATLVCPHEEMEAHRRSLANNCVEGVTILGEPPPGFRGIAPKRRWIFEHSGREQLEKIIMLDDDLTFSTYTIGADGKVKLPRASAAQTEAAFAELWKRITPEVPHAGFGPRQGASFKAAGWEPGRMLCVLGYHVPTVLRVVKFYHGETFAKEDMDITLQLLRAGYPNTVCNSFVADQQWGTPGGCSLYRTTDSNSSDSEELARLHPGYVRVVEKTYDKNTRKEVVVSWQRALRDGMARRGVVS